MNDCEYAFALIIKELEYRITNSANEEEKKRLRSEKIKYVNKLIKCIEFYKQAKPTYINIGLRELRK